MSHKPLKDLARELREAGKQLQVGGVYAHYKHPELLYKVTGLVIWEATDEVAVLYEAQYGEHVLFARALNVWLETVEWRGKTVPRFAKLGDESLH